MCALSSLWMTEVRNHRLHALYRLHHKTSIAHCVSPLSHFIREYWQKTRHRMLTSAYASGSISRWHTYPGCRPLSYKGKSGECCVFVLPFKTMNECVYNVVAFVHSMRELNRRERPKQALR